MVVISVLEYIRILVTIQNLSENAGIYCQVTNDRPDK